MPCIKLRDFTMFHCLSSTAANRTPLIPQKWTILSIYTQNRMGSSGIGFPMGTSNKKVQESY